MRAVKTWEILRQEEQQPYFRAAENYVRDERQRGKAIYPPEADMFKAFELTPSENVKAVILGQDPYHGAGQAHGLAFSVRPDIGIPPSLANIYKELAANIADFKRPPHGCLQSWAEQGVLLLNTVLTVEEGKPHSHAKIGWECFTDAVIKELSRRRQGLVFLLWGRYAQEKSRFIDARRHHILKAAHPSPLSAYKGFLGCRHFSETNRILQRQNQSPINWAIK